MALLGNFNPTLLYPSYLLQKSPDLALQAVSIPPGKQEARIFAQRAPVAQPRRLVGEVAHVWVPREACLIRKCLF
jgi:hypothetical protein